MSEQIIWVAEQDLCEYCDAILDHFGQCPTGCDLIESADWDEDGYEEVYYLGEYDQELGTFPVTPVLLDELEDEP